MHFNSVWDPHNRILSLNVKMCDKLLLFSNFRPLPWPDLVLALSACWFLNANIQAIFFNFREAVDSFPVILLAHFDFPLPTSLFLVSRTSESVVLTPHCYDGHVWLQVRYFVNSRKTVTATLYSLSLVETPTIYISWDGLGTSSMIKAIGWNSHSR